MPYHGGEFTVPNKSFTDVISESLQKHGDKTAIVDASQTGKSITFSELHQLARKVAAYLQTLGIKKGDYISISASGSVEFTCLAIGIIACGAVVAPCNPSYRKNEVLQQFKISSPRIVFVEEEGVETMKAVKAEFPSLEHIFVVGKSTEFTTLDKILSDTGPETLTKVDIDPANDVAFAPHSSGTTGLPKCAMMTHQNYVAAAMVGSFADTDVSSTIYCDRPMYHTGGYVFVFMSLINGAKIVTEREFHIDKFFKNIERYGISGMICVPPMLIEMANATDFDQYDLSSLKLVIAGGAAMPPDIIQRVIRKYKVMFILGYGMTESAGAITIGLISEGDTSTSTGKVRTGMEVKITDLVTEEECPIGSEGEIRIKSPQVTKGYLGNPEANAAAFDQDGWFRTGDIGHLDEHGHVYVIDRLKEIINYKSVQVSPAELESVIIRHSKVGDVGVVGIPDEACGELPKAFVVSKDQSLTAADIHKIVSDNLVEYKHLRGGIEFVLSIPKSKTGKIQRNILKKMAGF